MIIKQTIDKIYYRKTKNNIFQKTNLLKTKKFNFQTYRGFSFILLASICNC